MRIHQLSVEDAFASLDSGPDGISQAEARRRLAEFRPNQVERIEMTPLLVRFLRQFSHFFALILMDCSQSYIDEGLRDCTIQIDLD